VAEQSTIEAAIEKARERLGTERAKYFQQRLDSIRESAYRRAAAAQR
jgi:hypothetical protein